MSPSGRLLLALAAALGLHAAALAAVASWVPARPVPPTVLRGFVVEDPATGTPAEAQWRVSANAAAGAILRVEVRPSSGAEGSVQEWVLPVGAVEGSVELDLPEGAAGPWVAVASLIHGVGDARRAEFWVDDGLGGDLAAEGLDAGGTTAAAGGALRVAWTRVNRGAGWLRGGGGDRVTVEAGGETLAAAVARGFPPLPPGGASTHTLTLALPENFAGVATLRLDADAGRVLAEPHGPENAATLPLLVEPSPFPDLAAVRLDVGEAATLREDAARPVREQSAAVPVLGGAALPVRLVVENLRPAETPGGHVDAVYLSDDAVLDGSDVELARFEREEPLAGRARDAAAGGVVVPAERAERNGGRAFLIGVADAGATLDEGGPSHRRNNAVAVEVAVRAPSEEPDDTPLGEDDRQPRVTVAWIPHEAFEELLARKHRTLQPAAQAAAAPTPDAPLRDATTPPVPPRPPSPPEAAPAETADEAATPPPAAGTPAAAGSALPASGPGEVPPEEPSPRTVDEKSPEPSRSADPAEEPSETPATPPTPLPAPEGPAEPTSAPKSESSTDATADATEVRPGEVEVGPGLRVDVTRPRIDPVAVISTVIHPPRVAVTFDTDGTVLHARILRSAGSNAVDAPILRSLYRWKASGDRLETWDAPRTFEFTFLFDR